MDYGIKLEANSNETFAEVFYDHDQDIQGSNQKRATTAKDVAKRKTETSNSKVYPQDLAKESQK